MYRLDIHATLHMLEDETILLRLPRGFRFCLLDCYYSKYRVNGFGCEINITTYVSDDEIKPAKRAAFRKIEESRRFLSFLYGTHINYEINKYKFEEPDQHDTAQIIPKSSKNISYIADFNDSYLKLTKEKQSIAKNAILYMSKALELWDLELFTESFLSTYKAIELISNYHKQKIAYHRVLDAVEGSLSIFFQQAYDETYERKRHQEIYNSVKQIIMDKSFTAKMKLLLTAKYYNLKEEEINLLKSADQIRSRDAAHGNIENAEINLDLLAKFLYIAKKLIGVFILSEDYKKVFLIYKIS